ncbi:MAG: MetQ/NlpA family ABC transporter substrate-binding protein, partial [Coriobacteriia bacterium]|nr:MetQ/NlpA family ABC transporter substrate-binding protein [Coriobacteriia bacterium]
LEAAAVPRQLDEVDLGVINGNVALTAGLDPSTVLVTEDPDSEAAQTYANVLVVAAGHEEDPGIVALIELLKSDKTRDFINENYPGVVIPMF